MAQVDKKTDLDPVLDQHDAGEDKIQSAGAGAGAPWPPTPEIDPAAERRLVRKIDIKIMPIAVLLYICMSCLPPLCACIHNCSSSSSSSSSS